MSSVVESFSVMEISDVRKRVEQTMERARRYHRDGIEQHFSQHLSDPEIKALTRALEKISTHARPLRPGRIRG